MKPFSKSLLVFSLFVALMIASLYGAVTPKNTPISSVGSMQIAPHKNGLSLYQSYRGQYYSFSPFNDYEVGANYTRSSFISQDEIRQATYTSSLKPNNFRAILNVIGGYLGHQTPSMTFKTAKTIQYFSAVHGNRLTIIRTLILPENNAKKRRLGMTLSFHGGDFVYDGSGNLYNYWSDENMLAFERAYGIRLALKQDELQIPIETNAVAVVNRSVASTMVIKARPNQTLLINRNSKFIEIEEDIEPKDGVYTSSMDLEIYQDPKEAQQSL